MIDEVIALNRAEATFVARSRVPAESPVFEGHFPGYPLMPGVLLIETMAQASGYLIMALGDFARLPILASVKNAKLRMTVEPRSELIVEAAVEHDGSGFAVVNARIRNDGSPSCDAVLNMKTIPFPSKRLRDHILTSAEEAGIFALED